MNSYELSRKFWDYAFENPDKIKPIHPAIYFFAIEHCNRLGWKEKFGFPSQMVMEAIGVKNWRTYSSALNDLVEFGFLKYIEKSKNQYSSNIIAIVNFTKAQSKALDKALQKHCTKQSQSTVSVNKQLNKEQLNKEQKSKPKKSKKIFQPIIYETLDRCLPFFDEVNHPKYEKQKEEWLDVIEKLNRLDDLEFDDIVHLVQKTREDDFWCKNFLTITKLRKKNKDGVPYWNVFFNNVKENKHGKKKGRIDAINEWGERAKRQSNGGEF